MVVGGKLGAAGNSSWKEIRAKQYSVSSYGNTEYDAALGTFTVYKTHSRIGPDFERFFGLYDEYDFNTMSGDNLLETIMGKNENRSLRNEWKTRGVNWFSPSTAKPYKITR